MKTKPAHLPALAIAVVLMAGAGVPAADTDLTWIGRLPGVSLPSGKPARPGPKTVYTLSGEVDAALSSIRDGLVQRRWEITGGNAAPSGKPAASRTVVADKGGTRVKIVGRRSKGISNLTVTVVRGLGASGTAR